MSMDLGYICMSVDLSYIFMSTDLGYISVCPWAYATFQYVHGLRLHFTMSTDLGYI